MSGVERNRLRWRAVRISRAFKGLFHPIVDAPAWPARIVGAVLQLIGLRSVLRAWAYRIVFTADGSTRRMAADHVLSDLRDYSFARTSAFDPDPIIMARRQGRRDVWLRISNYLNLDEAQVQTLMEIDDGI